MFRGSSQSGTSRHSAQGVPLSSSQREGEERTSPLGRSPSHVAPGPAWADGATPLLDGAHRPGVLSSSQGGAFLQGRSLKEAPEVELRHPGPHESGLRDSGPAFESNEVEGCSLLPLASGAGPLASLASAGTVQQGALSSLASAGTVQQGALSSLASAGTVQQGALSSLASAGTVQQGGVAAPPPWMLGPDTWPRPWAQSLRGKTPEPATPMEQHQWSHQPQGGALPGSMAAPSPRPGMRPGAPRVLGEVLPGVPTGEEGQGACSPRLLEPWGLETPLLVAPGREGGGEGADSLTGGGDRCAGGSNRLLPPSTHNTSNLEWRVGRERAGGNPRAHTRSASAAAACPLAALIPEGDWALDGAGRLRFVPSVSQPRAHTWTPGSAGRGAQLSPGRSHSCSGSHLNDRRHSASARHLNEALKALPPLSGRVSSETSAQGLGLDQGDPEGASNGEGAPPHEGEEGGRGSPQPGCARDLGAQGGATALGSGAVVPSRAWAQGPRRSWMTGWQGEPYAGEADGGCSEAMARIATQRPPVPWHSWNDRHAPRQPCPATSLQAANGRLVAPRTMSVPRVSQLQWIPIDRPGSGGHTGDRGARRSNSLAGGEDSLAGLRHAAWAFLQRHTGEPIGASQSASLIGKADTEGRVGDTARVTIPDSGMAVEFSESSMRGLRKRRTSGSCEGLPESAPPSEGGALSEPLLLGRGALGNEQRAYNELAHRRGGHSEQSKAQFAVLRGSHSEHSEAHFAAVLGETSPPTSPWTQLLPLQSMGSQLAVLQADQFQTASRGNITAAAGELPRNGLGQDLAQDVQGETLLHPPGNTTGNPEPPATEREGGWWACPGSNASKAKTRESPKLEPGARTGNMREDIGIEVQPQLPHCGSLPMMDRSLKVTGQSLDAAGGSEDGTDSPKRIKLFGLWMSGDPGST